MRFQFPAFLFVALSAGSAAGQTEETENESRPPIKVPPTSGGCPTYDPDCYIPPPSTLPGASDYILDLRGKKLLDAETLEQLKEFEADRRNMLFQEKLIPSL